MPLVMQRSVVAGSRMIRQAIKRTEKRKRDFLPRRTPLLPIGAGPQCDSDPNRGCRCRQDFGRELATCFHHRPPGRPPPAAARPAESDEARVQRTSLLGLLRSHVTLVLTLIPILLSGLRISP